MHEVIGEWTKHLWTCMCAQGLGFEHFMIYCKLSTNLDGRFAEKA